MTLAVALMLATIIGQAAGILGRYAPFIPNKIIPKVVWAVNFMANLVLVAQKFLESSGLTAPGVAWYRFQDDSTIAYAGIGGFFKGALIVVGGAVLAYVQVALQRLIHEKAIKPVNSPTGDSGVY